MNKVLHRIFTPVNMIGFVLVMMAGWLDTMSLLVFLDNRSSSMTGRASKLGLLISKGDPKALVFVLLIILSFMAGAYFSTLIVGKTGLTGGLFFSGLILILTSLTSLKPGMYLLFITIPMAIGALNAATSLTAISRTTHLTGTSTDLGINLAKGNWDMVVFLSLKWLGFISGILISLKVIQGYNAHMISKPFLLMFPAWIIILTAIVQKVVLDLPLLEPNSKALGHRRPLISLIKARGTHDIS